MFSNDEYADQHFLIQ